MTSASRTVLRWLGAFLAGLAAVLLFGVFVAGVVVVHGHSMEPTLHNGEHVLELRTGAWLHRFGMGSFRPGDIVFFPDPVARTSGLQRLLNEHLLIKRIVAGPGATVGLEDGSLVVDGRARPERYLRGAFHGTATVSPARIPNGRVYVMGDNRHRLASFDSRSFGPIPAGSIEGRAVLVVWPLIRRTKDGWHWNVRLLTVPPTTARPSPAVTAR